MCEAEQLEGAYWPAAALLKACNLEESKGLVAMLLDEIQAAWL